MEHWQQFWISYSDEEIHLTLHQYFFAKFGNKVGERAALPSQFLQQVYYVTIGLEEVIDNGWEAFKKQGWEAAFFLESLAYFYAAFGLAVKKRVEQKDLYDTGDQVVDYLIDHKVLLKDKLAKALRHKCQELEQLLPSLLSLAQQNRKTLEELVIEQWKQDF